MIPKYDFDEKAVAAACARSKTFMRECGYALDPNLFTDDICMLIVDKAQTVFRNTGNSSISRAAVEIELRSAGPLGLPKPWGSSGEKLGLEHDFNEIVGTDFDAKSLAASVVRQIVDRKTRRFQNFVVENPDASPTDLRHAIGSIEVATKPEVELVSLMVDDIIAGIVSDVPDQVLRTGSNTLDTALGVGGIPEYTMTVLMGDTGAGKTYCLAAIGAQAVRDNKRVVVVTVEQGVGTWKALLYKAMLGVDNDEAKDPDIVRKRAKKHLGGVGVSPTILKVEDGESPAGIKALVGESVTSEIDVLIIDYICLLGDDGQAKKTSNEWEKFRYIADDLRDMCQEGGLCRYLVSAAQMKRGGANDSDDNPLARVAGSYWKLRRADIVITIDADQQMLRAGQRAYTIAKNRFGRAGETTGILTADLARVKPWDVVEFDLPQEVGKCVAF